MINHKGNLEKAKLELSKNKNAVAHVYLDVLENKNNGELQGTIFTLKDLVATEDAPTQASSKILESFIPYYDATIVQKIKNAGGTIVAKVHSDELGLGGSGEYNAYGKIRHSLDENRIIGGSSSGSVATFTNNIGIAIGTDTGDSSRLPASYNGVVGFKPSYGAISRYGIYQYASSLDTVGIFSHSVADAITTSKVLFGRDEKDMTSRDVEKPELEIIKPQSVAILDDQSLLRPEVKSKLNELNAKLNDDGIQTEIVSIDSLLLDAIDTVYSIISYSEASSNDSNLTGIQFGKREEGNNWEEVMTNSRTEGLGYMVQRRFVLGAWFLSVENQVDMFQKAQKVRRKIVDAFNSILDKFDVIVFPSADIAPIAAEKKNNNWTSSYLIHSNLSGAPSISIPFTKFNNLPIGLSISGKLYQDKKMLSHALYFEEIIGGNYE